MATAGRVYTPTFDDAPNVRQRIVTRKIAAAGDLTALGTAPAVVIVDVDGDDWNVIADALRAVMRRISRDRNTLTAPSGADTVTGASSE